RRRDRPPPLGRALRPRPRGHLRDPGRGDDVDRRDPARSGRGGGTRSPRGAPQRGRVEAAPRDRAARLTTDNMAAYECVLTGKVLHHRSNREDNAKAERLLERAIELDPNYAHAHAWGACVLRQTWPDNWCESRPETQLQIMKALETAL